MEKEYLNYALVQMQPTDPISVFTPDGNLVNHFETEAAARREIRIHRIAALAEEIRNIAGLRD